MARTHPLLAWVVTRNEAAHPGQYVARLVTDAITPYVLLADTLGELHAKLPPGLVRSDHQPSDPGIVWKSGFRRRVKALAPAQSPNPAERPWYAHDAQRRDRLEQGLTALPTP